jgi:hypothetical protein
MKIKTTRKQEIQEVPWGVYLWQMPDGSFIGDDSGHFLMIASTRGNAERMKALRDAAREFGVTEGQPCFFQGNRIVSDEEYEEQKLRLKFGLTPDKWDVAAINESRRNASNGR